MACDPFAMPFKSDASLTANKSQEDQLPTSRSFSFSLSEFWKPTKDPILQWLRDLPTGPVRREEALEPARYHTLKHSIVRHVMATLVGASSNPNLVLHTYLNAAMILYPSNIDVLL